MVLSISELFKNRTTSYYNPRNDLDESFIAAADEWETHVESVLKGLQPNGQATLSQFRAQLGPYLPSNLRVRTKGGRAVKKSIEAANPRIQSQLIQNRQNYIDKVNQLAETVFNSCLLPPPAFDDSDFNQGTGIICIGTIIAPNRSQMQAKWQGKKTFSANFPGHKNDAVIKPAANQPFQFVGGIPEAEAVARVKPNYGSMKLLGDSSAHEACPPSAYQMEESSCPTSSIFCMTSRRISARTGSRSTTFSPRSIFWERRHSGR